MLDCSFMPHMVQPLSLLQGVAALHVWAVSQTCCCLCICRHKKKPEWWASLEPSLHALGKDYQVRCDVHSHHCLTANLFCVCGGVQL